MIYAPESITVDVTGRNPDELIDAARMHAVSFWGPGVGVEVGPINASPHITRGPGGPVELWEATVTVTCDAR